MYRLNSRANEALNISIPDAPLSLSVYQADSNSFHVASTLVMGKTDAVLIDAQFTRADAHRVLANILDRGKNLTTIYISHGDPDFYFGADVIREAFPNVRVVATAQTAEYIRKTSAAKVALWSPQLGSNAPQKIIIPETLEQAFITLEGERLEMFGLDGDMPTHSVVWIPSLKAVVGGVLIYTDAHGFMADAQSTAERNRWLAALDAIEAMQPQIVIPTHAKPGAPCDITALHFTRDYTHAFEEELPKAASSKELIAAMKRRFPDAALDLPLEIGARVLKGEMAWV